MGAVATPNEVMPREHFRAGREGPQSASLRHIWLFVIAITIHNFPEGLAVGVGFGMVEPVGGATGAGLVSISKPLLPWASSSRQARCST